jgi:nicotinic acid mononucleotide adenylyltransferase
MLKQLYKLFDNDYIDFWSLLNIEFGESKQNVDKAYSLIENSKSNINEYYVAWKLLRDKKFEKLYKRCKSLKEVYDAGFFLDSLSLNEESIQSPYFLSIPTFNKKLDPSKKNIVLISTGGFSPVHDGHIYILETAKYELEKQGYNIVCGYLSPSHDDYVSTKDNGKAHNEALNRIKLCNQKIANSNWLMTSPQEAIYNRTSINYTDVIENLKIYVRQNISKDIIIGYVFGGDNAPFIKAFEDSEDMAICVTRNHKKEEFLSYNDFSYCNYKYIKKNPFLNESSTKIRNENKINTSNNLDNNYFLIRNDYEMFNFPKDLSPIEDLKRIFYKCLNESNTKIHTTKVSEQIKKAKKIIDKTKNKTISLDVYLKGDIDVSLSRIFNHSDSQLKSSGLVQRPENINEINYNEIKKGKYTLIEDDIVSGFTLKHLKSNLPKDVIIDNIILLSNFNEGNIKNYYDVVDLRDFIVNMEYSGLVVNINDEILRVPYIMPYVDVTNRASIHPLKSIYFTKKILELNINLYNEIKNRNITISLNQSIIKLCKILKIKREKNDIDTIIKFCYWHLEKIKGIN